MNPLKRRRGVLVLSIAGAIFGLSPLHSAIAYSGPGAASYADQYVYNHNPNFYTFSDDCTNFVSQAMWRGGSKAFHGTASPAVINDNNQWWVYNAGGGFGAGRTYSWSVSDSLARFLTYFDSGASGAYTQAAGSQGSYTPSAIVTGDPVFYDFQHNGTMDHVAIQVGIGYDSGGSGWYGNLVDEHSTDRKHVIWHLMPYNSVWAATVTQENHIYA